MPVSMISEQNLVFSSLVQNAVEYYRYFFDNIKRKFLPI